MTVNRDFTAEVAFSKPHRSDTSARRAIQTNPICFARVLSALPLCRFAALCRPYVIYWIDADLSTGRASGA